MFEKCSAVLKMIGVFLEDEPLDRTEYSCTVIRYDEEQERIYLVMNGEDITRISLDAEYNCTLMAEEELVCQGRVKERFLDKNGSQLVFNIENGFYKNNLN